MNDRSIKQIGFKGSIIGLIQNSFFLHFLPLQFMDKWIKVPCKYIPTEEETLQTSPRCYPGNEWGIASKEENDTQNLHVRKLFQFF